jgi:hypothetical protein
LEIKNQRKREVNHEVHQTMKLAKPHLSKL